MTKCNGTRVRVLGNFALASSMLFAGAAKAEVFDVQEGEFAGSFITSFFKYRVDEKTLSTTATGKIKKRLGDFQSHTVADLNIGGNGCAAASEEPLDPTVWLIPFYVDKSHVVLTFKNGQVFLKAEPIDEGTPAGSGCASLTFDPETEQLVEVPGGFDLTVHYKVVGGTGDYLGAQGNVVSTSTGTALEFNSTSTYGDNWFGGVTGTLEGSFCTDCAE